jgi:hypothetical protein
MLEHSSHHTQVVREDEAGMYLRNVGQPTRGGP